MSILIGSELVLDIFFEREVRERLLGVKRKAILALYPVPTFVEEQRGKNLNMYVCKPTCA